MIKAIFFDVDGTLLNRKSQIEPSSKIAIKEAQKKGILCGIATGRGPGTINDLVDKYDLDFAITYNGQYIYLKDRTVIHAAPFDKTTIREIANYADTQNREVMFGGSDFTTGSRLLRAGNSDFARLISPILPKEISNGLKTGFQHVVRKYRKSHYSKYPSLRNPIYQVVMISPEKEQETLLANFPSCTLTRSNPYSVDMIPKGGSKFKGIQIFCQKMNIDPSKTMAFGDSWNDLEMIEGVAHGVAMGNAVKALKDVADFVTTSNDRDGIARAFQQYHIIENDADYVSDLTLEDMKVETLEGEVDNLIVPFHSFESCDTHFNQVKEFHHQFGEFNKEVPTPFTAEEASIRAGFKVEEIVEFLQASSRGDRNRFLSSIVQLKMDIDKAVEKVVQTDVSDHDSDVLTGQVDALIDLLYFDYGSFAMLGVDPQPVFDIVHAANMGKLFPDGKPRYDEVTGKILKPENWAKDFAPEEKIKAEILRQKEERYVEPILNIEEIEKE